MKRTLTAALAALTLMACGGPDTAGVASCDDLADEVTYALEKQAMSVSGDSYSVEPKIEIVKVDEVDSVGKTRVCLLTVDNISITTTKILDEEDIQTTTMRQQYYICSDGEYWASVAFFGGTQACINAL